MEDKNFYMVSAEQIQRLLEEAKQVRLQAYAPYSGYQVGAALLTKSGRIYGGCNIENASYGAAICAERVAVVRAIAAGGDGLCGHGGGRRQPRTRVALWNLSAVLSGICA